MLFRQDALAQTRDRLHGQINIAVPLSWRVLTYGLLTLLLAAVGLLSFGTYARTELVAGTFVPDKGTAAIVAPRGGVIEHVRVREAERVVVGAPLIDVRVEEDGRGGSTAGALTQAALDEQVAAVRRQGEIAVASERVGRARLQSEADGLRREIEALDAEIAVQQRLVEVAEMMFAKTEDIATRGFISQRDRQAREEAVLTRRQQLSELGRERVERQSRLAQVRQTILEQAQAAAGNLAGFASARAGLAERRAEIDGSRGYSLKAPVAGVATAITARLGQAIAPGSRLLAIVPEGSTLEAELRVPTHAIGFVKAGQAVNLQVDAFPYQHFGTIPARVRHVSSVAVDDPSAPQSGSYYIVTAELDRTAVRAFGREHRLQPGMTLRGAIVTDRRSLFEWLFEPVLALRERP